MKLLLNDNWKVQYFEHSSYDDENVVSDTNTDSWLDVAVPGDVHSTLLKHGKIENPFYATNVEKCRWIEDKIWWYKQEFDFDKNMYSGKVIELKFNGLDTFATIYLNGEMIGSHENMFTPAAFDVTEKLKQGTNHIAVKFDSMLAVTEKIAVTNKENYDRMWYSYNTNRAWARKAQMNTRWDWGPRIITVGIWKNVELNIYDAARIEDIFIRTEKIENNIAEISVDINTKVFQENAELVAEVDFIYGDEKISETISIVNGSVSLKLNVNHPKLWWTNDLGDSCLYDVVIRLKKQNEVIDEYFAKFGIRTLEVKQKDEKGNSRFIFVLNGVELFAKGANWIPAHNFIGAIQDETYVKWIDTAKESNMNMLRIWGGGIYEKDIFYQECDKQGILVWQDFMFACSSYPDFDHDFMNNVREEINYVVKSLRNYTCLAIWCGNNEIQWIHGQKMPELKDMRLYGEKIYHDLMPELLSSLDPTRLYWPSSPFGGNDPNSDDEGDKHNWQVWAGQVYPHKQGEPMLQDNTPSGISFKRFTQDMGKFVSEFGMHAAPVLETLKDCIPEKDLYYGSFQMRYRNRDKRPDRGILLMEGYTGLPSDLNQYIDYSMLAQAEGLKFGIEHYRRRKPECSGALIWQLNDCWPVLSWSIADFYLRPKAGFYYTKRVFKPILLSFKEESSDIISLWVTNDTLNEYADTLEVGLKDFFGNTEYYEEVPAVVPANTSVKVKEFSKNRIDVTYTNFEFLYVTPSSKSIDSNIMFFKDYKDLNLPPCTLHTEVRNLSDNKKELKIKTDSFAKFVKIQYPIDNMKISDNYFDLMPSQEKLVIIEGKEEDIKNVHIQVTALNSIQA